MKIKSLLHILFLSMSTTYFAQVDVVYNDLVWSDEFNGSGMVDNTKWFHQTQLPSGGSWYNGELQHYTDQQTNSFQTNGLLNLVAKKEVYTDQGVTKNYTSARLNSKFSFKYGRVDVRAKIPVDSGIWPAIWLLGKNVNEPGGYFASSYGTVNWPACGEIDTMEHGIFPSQPVDYVQSTLHTPSSSGNSVNKGGIIASDLANNYHIYSMNWSPYQITFLLDGVAYYSYNPTVKDANTWPFDKEQYMLLNIAVGGTAGTVADNFSQASMLIDYVRVYQNVTPDTQAPINFTATLGNVTKNSIELLLNGTDNSGTILYNITGDYSNAFANQSGVQKSIIISGLNPDTTYKFNISASDLTGNTASNNPVVITAKTLSNTNTQCFGTSTEASQGAFSLGYNYSFQTIGTDVKFNFELLDVDKAGVVAYLWEQSPFSEVPMTNVSGKIFTKTISGQTIGNTINYGVKFAYAGGMSVTKYFSYVVGNTCSLGVHDVYQKKAYVFPNPVIDTLHLHLLQDHTEVTLTDSSGKQVLHKMMNSTDDSINMRNCISGIYYLKFKNNTDIQYVTVIKK